MRRGEELAERVPDMESFVEEYFCPVTEELEAAQEAVDLKNDFLEAATGRDAEARRDSMKRQVEDDPDDVPGA